MKKNPERISREEACKTCPYSGSVQVPYAGNRDSKIIFVGEAPAVEEVKAGLPFVGRSGKLLESLLARIKLDRSEVIIANSLRCMIDNKDTKKVKEGMKHCRSHLVYLIQRIKPQLIVCLGAIALAQILKGKQILKQRGRFFRSEEFECDVFVTVHPAFVLRSATKNFPNIPLDMMSPKERMIINDFDILKEYLESGVKPTLDMNRYTEVDDFDMVNGGVISIDFETTSADYHSKECRVLSVSISDGIGKAYTHVFGKKIPKYFKRLLADKKIVKVVTARPFDENVCKKLLGCEMKGDIHDILTLAHVLDENSFPAYNLGNIAEVYAGMKGIKDVAEGFRGNLADAPRDVLVRYNSVDADATLRSFNKMIELLDKDEKVKRYYYKFIRPVQDMLADISLNGVKIDIDKLRANEAIVTHKVQTIFEESKTLLPRGIWKYVADGYSLTKNAMLQQILFTHPKGFKRKPVMLTEKTKTPQVNEAHLKMFSDIPFVAKVLEWKKAYKILSTYFPMIWDSLKEDGRVYPTVSLSRTQTGRTVTLDPGITIIPARGELAKYIKDVFVADEGWLLGARDLSQSEIRIMGWIAQDKNILSAIASGIDIHTKTASIVNKVPVEQVTKEQRQAAKGVNFGFLYGMMAKTFRVYAKENYNIDYTEAECEEIRKSFFAYPNGYYNLPAYYKRVEEKLRAQGYICSPLGRKRRLPAIWSSDRIAQSEAIRQAINFPIQSFSSDLGLISMYLFWVEYRKSKALRDRVKALWFIHDNIIFTARKEVFEDAMMLLKECMEEKSKEYILKEFGIKVNYPIGSDAKCGESWGTLKDMT